MADDPEIVDRLDRIEAALRIAFAAEIDEFKARIRADNVYAAILDAADDWTPSAELQAKVSKKVSLSARRVRDRFPELVAYKVLQMRGPDASPEYRITGVI